MDVETTPASGSPRTPPGRSRAGARPEGAASARGLVALLAVVTAVAAELVRASGPLIDAAFTSGVLTAALTATGTYAAAGLLVLALGARRPVDGRVVLLGVGALAVARLAVQALDGALRYGVALATVALALATVVLVAAVVGRVSGRAVAAGVGGGLALSAALTLALRTWDALWRPGPTGWVVTVLLLGAAVTLAWRLRTTPAAPAVRGLWLLGPYLGLAVMTVANPAFISSQTGLPLWTAGLVGALATAATMTLLALPAPDPARLPAWTDAVVLVVSVGAAVALFAVPVWPQAPGPGRSVLVALAVVVLAGSTTIALAQALTRPTHRQRPRRLAGAASCAGLGLILPLLVYQLDYDVPLGFPNVALPVGVAALVAGMSVRARGRARAFAGEVVLTTTPLPVRAQAPALVVAGALTAIGVVLVVPHGPPEAIDRVTGTLRLLDWNLHYGVSAEPGVELAEIAAVIEASGADVVTLQEVSRGWVLGGGADMATYLALETGMSVVFVPAADPQFGNAILWHPALGELTDVEATALPYGQGPQRRSAVSGTLTDGAPLRITSVHLQHRDTSTPTRLAQLGTLLEAQPLDGPWLLGGDLNAEPGWPELVRLDAAGLVSAQDVAGDAGQLTFPSDLPTQRIDWVLGSQVTFSDVTVLETVASDHRPIVATVTVAPATP